MNVPPNAHMLSTCLWIVFGDTVRVVAAAGHIRGGAASPQIPYELARTGRHFR
jgi:hypothetical protein